MKAVYKKKNVALKISVTKISFIRSVNSTNNEKQVKKNKSKNNELKTRKYDAAILHSADR